MPHPSIDFFLFSYENRKRSCKLGICLFDFIATIDGLLLLDLTTQCRIRIYIAFICSRWLGELTTPQQKCEMIMNWINYVVLHELMHWVVGCDVTESEVKAMIEALLRTEAWNWHWNGDE